MVTIKDIAREAGVAHPTVSLVLNGKAKQLRISDKVAEKVLAAAKRLGYARNEIARSMVTGHSRIIAFVAEDMGVASYTGKIQEGVFEEASERGYAVSFYHLRTDNRQAIVAKLREWQVAGVVFHVDGRSDIAELREVLDVSGIPSGTVDLSDVRDSGIGVTTDNFQGAVEMVGHLAGLGHRRVAHVGRGRGCEYEVARREGYLEGMRRFAADSPPRLVEFDGDARFPAYERLLSEPEGRRPTAVFCGEDNLALELLRAAARRGIKVPEELSIAGFGDLDMLEYAVVPLTTIAQPFVEMGRRTVAEVIAAVGRHVAPREAVNLKLPTRLIVRESTASPNVA